MLLEKQDYPEEEELVLATITKVNPNSVFCTLDHYGGKTGLIHISEISPGRIRNIRDYVQEDKKQVVKVLGVDEKKGHIDLSLRRVTEMQKRSFQDLLKQERKAEGLIELFAEENKLKKADLNKLVKEVGKKYEYLHEFFNAIVEDNIKANEVISKKAKALEDYVKQRIQPPQVRDPLLGSRTLYHRHHRTRIQIRRKETAKQNQTIRRSS